MKTYEIEFDDLMWKMIVEVNHSKANYAIRGMVEFWLGWEEKLSINEGNYTLTFLQMLGNECLRTLCSENLNVEGIIQHFVNKEGWVPMDGSKGIEIIYVDSIDFSDHDFTVLSEGEYI